MSGKLDRWRVDVVLSPRLSWPKPTIAAVMLACKGRCVHPGCGRKDGLDIDHIVPLALGGSNEPDNLQLLCKEHHSQKTKQDVARIAKAKRQAKREIEGKPEPKMRSPEKYNWPSQKIPSRGFSVPRPS